MSKKNRNNNVNANVNNETQQNPAPEAPATETKEKVKFTTKVKNAWNTKPVKIIRKGVVYGAAVFGAVAGVAIAADTQRLKKSNPGQDEPDYGNNAE